MRTWIFWGGFFLTVGFLAIPSGQESVATTRLATISGTVTADRGVVRGFQVKARDTVRRITYTVFTRGGQYRVPDLPPGSYEIRAVEPGFDPAAYTVALGPADKRRLDLTLTRTRDAEDEVPLVDYEALYPPDPGRAELEAHCMSCHGRTSFHLQRRDADGWKRAVALMTEYPGHRGIPVYRTLPPATRQLITRYLIEHFGPDAPRSDLKLDTFLVDEDEVADAIYQEYELPPSPRGRRRLHDPYVAPDGSIWFGDTGAASVIRLDPRVLDFQKRVTEYLVPDAKTGIHGITVDRQGRVYWADTWGGELGELDPKTGDLKEYKTMPESTMLQVVVDEGDNVWFGLVHGDKIGRLDARSRQISLWDLPTPDANPYGLIVDRTGKLWTAGIAKHIIIRFDPASGKFTEYPTARPPSGPRRLGADMAGKIWYATYFGGTLEVLDPETGRIEAYPFPLRYTQGYEAWPVGDVVWSSDNVYSSLVKFDPKTKKFTYYPLPQVQAGPGVPKIEVEKDGTIWFGYRGLQNNTAVAFKPTGNTIARDR